MSFSAREMSLMPSRHAEKIRLSKLVMGPYSVDPNDAFRHFVDLEVVPPSVNACLETFLGS